MRLEPQSQFILARGLEDHTDSTTYYVQAVIRDRKTDQLLGTVNLTDNGERRFTKAWQVPPDPTGEGRDILITYTVYTDSGYTTKATNYGERFDAFRVEHMPKHGGGGGVDVDYKRVRQIVQEELDKRPYPETKNADFSPLADSLQAILTEIREIHIPEPEKVTFTPLMSRLDALENAVKQAVNDKDVTPEPDLEPIRDAIAALKADFQPDVTGFQEKLDALFTRIQKYFSDDIEEVKSAVSGIQEHIDDMPYMIVQSPQKPKKTKEEKEINYDELL